VLEGFGSDDDLAQFDAILADRRKGKLG